MSNAPRERAPTVAAVDLPVGQLRLPVGTLTATSAAAVFGPVAKGRRVFALSKGAIGFGDALLWLLQTAGPADLLIATWTIAGREIRALRDLVDGGQVRGLRLLVDDGFVRRQRAYAALLRSMFGPACIRLATCHAKLATVVNAAHALVLKSSANLNRNDRTEFYEVEDNRRLATLINDTLGEWFKTSAPDQFDQPARWHAERFAAWHAAEPHAAPRERPALEPATPADAAFFSPDPFGSDLRRVGASYL